MEINVKKLATVSNSRTIPMDDNWGGIISEIELAPWVPTEAFDNIEAFSQLEIIYYFDRVAETDIVFSGRPRDNADYPLTGILAQRKKDRPNKLGLCRVELLEHQGRKIIVKNLDAIDGTPVIDIKPVLREFQIPGEIKQPSWAVDVMKNYWKLQG